MQTNQNDSVAFPHIDRWLRIGIEIFVLLLVAIAPWRFGSWDPKARFYLSLGFFAVLCLWSIRLLLVQRWSVRGNGPLYCLCGIACLSFLQLVPLPSSWLSIFSHGSADLYSFYLPIQSEAFAGEATSPRSAWHPISISPVETKEFLIDCLALCILYGAVVNNIATPAAFMRLAIVAVIVGTSVSLLAFAQRLSSDTHTIYWSIKVKGPSFGPFQNRHIFPFLANVCIGLALGMLLATAQKSRSMLQNARALWLLSALGVMMIAVLYCLARSGILAMLGSMALGMMIRTWNQRHRFSSGLMFWIVPIILIAGAWFFWPILEKRFSDIATDQSFSVGRWQMWKEVLRLTPDFPLFGTGNGTFWLAELMERRDGRGEAIDLSLYDHAHNDFVEALVEGGLVRLAFTVALVAIITAAGLRNYRKYDGRTLGALVLGGLIGFWAFALNSITDFGMCFPAQAILITVTVAHLVSARQHESPEDSIKLPLAVCGILAAVMVMIAGLLVWDCYRKDQAERFINATVYGNVTLASAPFKDLTYLEVANRLQPNRYDIHIFLSDCYLAASQAESNPIKAKDLLRQSLEHCRTARDLSPLCVPLQLRLALYRDEFERAESSVWYIDRAKRSSPSDPFVWYVSGKLRHDMGDRTAAWHDWNKSLSLSIANLEPIVKTAKADLTPSELLSHVLPDRPEIIAQAAYMLYPQDSGSTAERQPFLLKSLDLLELRGNGRTAQDELLRGCLLRELKRGPESIDAFRAGIQKQPTLNELRWELARELYELEMFAEAKRELLSLLGREPQNLAAKELLARTERELILLE